MDLQVFRSSKHVFVSSVPAIDLIEDMKVITEKATNRNMLHNR